MLPCLPYLMMHLLVPLLTCILLYFFFFIVVILSEFILFLSSSFVHLPQYYLNFMKIRIISVLPKIPGIKEILSSYLWNEWMNEFVVDWVYIHFPPGAWLVGAEVTLTVWSSPKATEILMLNWGNSLGFSPLLKAVFPLSPWGSFLLVNQS